MKLTTLSVFAMALLFAGASFAYPNSIAVMGDSISTAAVADGGLPDEQPWHSWSTGWDPDDACYSHYERIRDANSAILGNNFNNAENGRRVHHMVNQANVCISQGVEYVTIQIGGNDICRDHVDKMPSVSEWIGHYEAALDTLQAGLPSSLVLVTDVVNVRRVYDVGRSNFGCLLKWELFQFCDTIQRNGSTQRSIATQRLIDYNNALYPLCAAKGIPIADVYSYNFSRGQLSSFDCFHPGVALQGVLAERSYDASRF